MKKTLICMMLLTMLLVMLCGCGNKAYGPGNYQFDKVHVFDDGHSRCIEINKWYDNEQGIEVQKKDGNGLFFSEGTYMLVEGKCPICD